MLRQSHAPLLHTWVGFNWRLTKRFWCSNAFGCGKRLVLVLQDQNEWRCIAWSRAIKSSSSALIILGCIPNWPKSTQHIWC